MDKDERKPRLHIHIGGLVIIIIIVLVLFKFDIKSKINSPQFQKNVTYVEDQVKGLWQKYISGPLRSKTGDMFIDVTNQGLKKIQDNFTNNVFKTPTEDTVNKITN